MIRKKISFVGGTSTHNSRVCPTIKQQVCKCPNISQLSLVISKHMALPRDRRPWQEWCMQATPTLAPAALTPALAPTVHPTSTALPGLERATDHPWGRHGAPRLLHCSHSEHRPTHMDWHNKTSASTATHPSAFLVTVRQRESAVASAQGPQALGSRQAPRGVLGQETQAPSLRREREPTLGCFLFLLLSLCRPTSPLAETYQKPLQGLLIYYVFFFPRSPHQFEENASILCTKTLRSNVNSVISNYDAANCTYCNYFCLMCCVINKRKMQIKSLNKSEVTLCSFNITIWLNFFLCIGKSSVRI